jgi:anti-anti-sigma factor
MRPLAIWKEVLVLQVAGEIDLATITRLRERLHEHVPGAHQMVILDFTEVSFLGACGISLLVEIAGQAHAAGIALRLVAPSRAVRRALAVTGVDKLIPPNATMANAMSNPTNSPTDRSRLAHHTEIIALNNLRS